MRARSIHQARMRETGKLIVADELFTDQKTSFGYREMKNSGKLHFDCLECNQELKVQPSSRDRMYFSHKPKSKDCLLKQGTISQAEADSIVEYVAAKESDRHKYLKHLIGEKLRATVGVKADSVRVDDYVIVKGDQKRRPDVYCVFEGKEVVFEIQLSNLSQSYILNRHNFYTQNKIYLVWILDNFDCKNPNQPFVRDLKYIAPHENYFKVNESPDDFHLICDFKEVYEAADEVRSKWKKRSVHLSDLIFDPQIVQVYFYNTNLKSQELQNSLDIKAEIRQEARDKEIANSMVKKIASYRNRGALAFDNLTKEIDLLSDRQVSFLNENLHNKVTPLEVRLFELIRERNSGIDDEFILFFFKSLRILIDVNYIHENRSFLEAIAESKMFFKNTFYQSLMRRGFRIDEIVQKKMHQYADKNTLDKSFVETMIIADRLKDKALVHAIFDNDKFFFSLETIYHRQVIGHNYKTLNWIQIVNLELTSRPQYWHLVSRLLSRDNLYEEILKQDRNGSFRAKLSSHEKSSNAEDRSLDDVFMELYSEWLPIQ